MSQDTQKEKVVKVEEKTTVYATAKAKHYQEGAEMRVHPVLAEKLIKQGKATAEKQEPKDKK